MSESKKTANTVPINKVQFKGGVVSGTDGSIAPKTITSIGFDGVVSGTKVQRIKNQIPKSKSSQ